MQLVYLKESLRQNGAVVMIKKGYLILLVVLNISLMVIILYLILEGDPKGVEHDISHLGQINVNDAMEALVMLEMLELNELDVIRKRLNDKMNAAALILAECIRSAPDGAGVSIYEAVIWKLKNIREKYPMKNGLASEMRIELDKVYKLGIDPKEKRPRAPGQAITPGVQESPKP